MFVDAMEGWWRSWDHSRTAWLSACLPSIADTESSLHNRGLVLAYTVRVQTTEIDLPTLVSLAGPGVTDHLLARVVDGGFSGVKRSHGYVIQRLVNDEPTITALAHALGMTQQGASKQVTELETLGLVERYTVPGDQRVRRVRLSSKGEELLAAGRHQRQDLERALVEQVGRECVDQARIAVAGLLDLIGLGEQVPSRSVPMPQA